MKSLSSCVVPERNTRADFQREAIYEYVSNPATQKRHLRVTKIKEWYDPGNLFRVDQNIRPK